MLEYAGATGVNPGPFQWWEFERIYLGRRREDYGVMAVLACSILNAFGGKLQPSDITNLVPRIEQSTPVPLLDREAAAKAFRDHFSGK